MEVIAPGAHAVFPMQGGLREADARRHVLQCATEAGFDSASGVRAASVVTELANNLARHARNGRLLIACRPAQGELEILAIDEGPGMERAVLDVQRAPASSGPAGSGLGRVRQLAQMFDVHTSPRGTVAVARLWPRGRGRQACAFSIGGVSVAAPGEQVCGDAWIVACEGELATVMLADGLGHGPGAALAASAATQAFTAQPFAAPPQHLARIHEALGGTRGAAVSVFGVDATLRAARMCGAGNVLGRLLSGVSDRSFLPQSGTAGLRIRTPEEISLPWPAHGVLVVFSDGIESRWDARELHPLLTLDPSIMAAVLLRDHCRGNDDATVVVVRHH
jgi:anti-sigma regulatory factor (Ser/Thr protein kinase)